jgi:hypothetical protein
MDIDELKEINIAVAKSLLKVYKDEDKLFFPKKRDKKTRYSEQEARVLFFRHLHEKTNGYRYAVEVPTSEEYSFTGAGSRSGNIDISIYNTEKIQLVNVELKSGKDVKPAEITKDFKKLVIEPNALGNWFHFLSGWGNDTWGKIQNKYQVAWEKANEEMVERYNKTNIRHPQITDLIGNCRNHFETRRNADNNVVSVMIESCDLILNGLINNEIERQDLRDVVETLRGVLVGFDDQNNQKA